MGYIEKRKQNKFAKLFLNKIFFHRKVLFSNLPPPLKKTNRKRTENDKIINIINTFLKIHMMLMCIQHMYI